MAGIRVLLVDDEKDFTETLAKRLSKRGFEVAPAFSGDEAIAQVLDKDIDVVVLDIVMPGRDGIQTLQEIKRLKPLTEVIMLSGHGSLENAVHGMSYGAYDFLMKPPEIAELVEKIKKASERKREHEERIRKADLLKKQLKEKVAEPERSDTLRATVGKGSDLRLMLVIGRHSDFPGALIEYALSVAKRMQYQIIALSAAGFDKASFRNFEEAREQVCGDFRDISEKNAALFRTAAQQAGVSFSHVVKFCGDEEAMDEVKSEVGDIDYVVCEYNDPDDPSSKGQIVAYAPVWLKKTAADD